MDILKKFTKDPIHHNATWLDMLTKLPLVI